MADLCGLALFSRAFGRGDGADADHRRRPDPPRLRAGQALDARRQPRSLPPAATARARPAAADLPVGRTGGGGKEPRGPARASTCPARPSSSAMGRPAATSSAATAMRIFSAPSRARRWPTSMRARTCSFSPRAPIRSGSCMIEAMASGLPVAAFPVPGPIDVVAPGAGVLDEDLRAACLKALTIPREQAREHSHAVHLEGERPPVPRQYRSQPSRGQTAIASSPGAAASAQSVKGERPRRASCPV